MHSEACRLGNHPSRHRKERDDAALLTQERNSPAFTVTNILCGNVFWTAQMQSFRFHGSVVNGGFHSVLCSCRTPPVVPRSSRRNRRENTSAAECPTKADPVPAGCPCSVASLRGLLLHTHQRHRRPVSP